MAAGRAFQFFMLGNFLWEAIPSPIPRKIGELLDLQSDIGVGDASHRLCRVKKWMALWRLAWRFLGRQPSDIVTG